MSQAESYGSRSSQTRLIRVSMSVNSPLRTLGEGHDIDT